MNNLAMNYVSFVIFFVASLTDYYDGILARRYGISSVWGRFLDPLADKILISAALIVFAMAKFVAVWMVTIIIVRDVIITALRSYAMFKGKPIVTSYLAKAKTFSQVTVIYIIFAYILLKKTLIANNQNSFFIDKFIAWNIIDLCMLFVTLLTLVSGLKYLFENRSHLKSLVLDFYRVFVPSDL
jgi:CDP-diacylglycerol--glycerol-3-phosphate 3-phosphatidyltransferase